MAEPTHSSPHERTLLQGRIVFINCSSLMEFIALNRSGAGVRIAGETNVPSEAINLEMAGAPRRPAR